jgi:hypothetical protein
LLAADIVLTFQLLLFAAAAAAASQLATASHDNVRKQQESSLQITANC